MLVKHLKINNEQKIGFLSMSLGISRSNLLRNLSTHKGTIKASEGMIRAAGERN